MEEVGFRAIKYNVHTILQNKTGPELKTISTSLSLPVHLMLFNLDGNMNIAMSIRTAAVMGCSDVWIVGKRHYDGRPSVGSHHYVNVHKIDSVNLEFFTERNIQPILVEQGGTPLEEMSFKPFLKQKVCFIVGSESHGFPSEFLAEMGPTPKVTISQYGLIRSLNVSVAASIVMYEYLRQWRQNRKDV